MEIKRLPTHHKVSHTHSITESLTSVIKLVTIFFFFIIETECIYCAVRTEYYNIIYSVIQKDGLNFVRLYFLNYTWYENDLHNI